MVLPGMQDGRCFTTYISQCELNTQMMANQRIQDSNDFRRFLQTNAEQIMKTTTQVCGDVVRKECEYCIDLGKRPT